MTFATLISFILGATLDIILLSYGARRLLAERRFSLSRTIVAGLAGQALTNAIFNALAGGLQSGRRLPPYGVRPLIRGPWSASLARSLSEALDRSGVVFVKFGQALSTRRDLLPPEFITELGRLQDRVSPRPAPGAWRWRCSRCGAVRR